MESNATWTSFSKKIDRALEGTSLKRTTTNTVQVNMGKLCNQLCRHCHVDAGPHRIKENMDGKTVDRLITVLYNSPNITTLDLTGGAPELNPHFRRLVSAARDMNLGIIDRCNLTVLFEEGQEDTAAFLAAHKVGVVASLPCYSRDNVEKQRGDGVFAKSIDGLKQLNQLGYGQAGRDLTLNLVYNPLGAHLPPPQSSLELSYKKALKEDFGITFNRLYTITNMPIKRFRFDLKRSHSLDAYMYLLEDHFNPLAITQLMCRNTISVGWDGQLFDCDFNQMLAMPLGSGSIHIDDIDTFSKLDGDNISIGDHCYGCTAGSGSSCGGSLL